MSEKAKGRFRFERMGEKREERCRTSKKMAEREKLFARGRESAGERESGQHFQVQLSSIMSRARAKRICIQTIVLPASFWRSSQFTSNEKIQIVYQIVDYYAKVCIILPIT